MNPSIPRNRPSETPEVRPIMFLDLDDVLVLNQRFGGYDVVLALANELRGKPPMEAHAELWTQLVASKAADFLRQLDGEFQPFYVLSTSWWWVMDEVTLKEALNRSGLDFVVRGLHVDMATPKRTRPDVRWNEIAGWLDAHPEFDCRWVVLDDELSGTGLSVEDSDARHPYIVLCKEHVGITRVEYEQLRTALRRRTDNRPNNLR